MRRAIFLSLVVLPIIALSTFAASTLYIPYDHNFSPDPCYSADPAFALQNQWSTDSGSHTIDPNSGQGSGGGPTDFHGALVSEPNACTLYWGSDYLTDSGILNESGGTIEMWISPDWNGINKGGDGIGGIGTSQLLLGTGLENDSILQGFQIMVLNNNYPDNGGSVFFWWEDSGGTRWLPEGALSPTFSPTGTENWTAGSWHHIAVCWNGEHFNLWVDGNEACNSVDVANDMNDQPPYFDAPDGALWIGGYSIDWGASVIYSWDGMIDDVVFWDVPIYPLDGNLPPGSIPTTPAFPYKPPPPPPPPPSPDYIKAQYPQPAKYATRNVLTDTVLSWKSGEDAITHKVYFDSNQTNVQNRLTNPVIVNAPDNSSYPPIPLELGEHYFWAVDEVNSLSQIHQGDLWSFCVTSCANPADFYGTGKIDAKDFAIFANTWKSQLGYPRWNHRCDISEPNDNIINEFDLLNFKNNWPRNDIRLEIYYFSMWYDANTMQDEGPITLFYEELEPDDGFFAYAFREGYYTDLYYCYNGDTINVKLDPIVPNNFKGTIFLKRNWVLPDEYLSNVDVNVVEQNNTIAQFQTDAQGRFTVDISPGTYQFDFNEPDGGGHHSEPVNIIQDYHDFFFQSNIMVLKPNIYIYPEETTELNVSIAFPNGGYITESVPQYNNGWQITVEPSGIIDGQYEYLFYESSQPDYCQYNTGWVIPTDQLITFFTDNLAQTGFNQNEIDDFLEYWIPRLTNHPYYAIFPQYNQELDEMIRLQFSIQPQNLIRLIYVIRGLENDTLNLSAPTIPPFSRDGFTVTEWGVISGIVDS